MFPFTTANYPYQPPSSSTAPAPSNQPLVPKPIQNITIKKTYPTELQEWRDKGLCYTYDERFVHGHKYKSKFHLLVHQDDNNDDSSSLLIHSLTVMIFISSNLG